MLSSDLSRALFKVIGLLAFVCLYSTAITAATLEAQLQKQAALLATKKASLETLESRLSSYEESKVEARDRLDKALADVVEAKVQLANAGSNQDTEGATQRELAQRSLALAEQGLESRQSRLNRIDKNFEKIQRSIIEHRDFITRQQATISSLKQQLANQAAQKSHHKQVAAFTPKPDVEKVTVEPVAPVGPTVGKADIEVTTSAALAADIARLPAPAAGPVAPVPLSQEQKDARAEMRRLHDLTKGADKKLSGRYQELELIVDRKDNIDFEYWGAGQYYAEFPLSAGKRRLQIKRRAFSVSISEANDGDTYVLIYDTSPRGEPRVAFFNQTLLED